MNSSHLLMNRNHKNNAAVNLEYRRDKVVELYSEGHSQPEIAHMLKMSQPTVNRDLQFRRRQSRNRVKTYLDEYLPFEHNVCQVGINRILRKAWDIINNEKSSEKSIFYALSLAKDCYAMKQELLADKVIIDRAIDFVQSHQEIKQLEVQSEIDNFYTRQAQEERNRSERVF